MNEMYEMSIVTHNFSVLAVLLIIAINLYKITKADDVFKYRKFNTLFNPIGGTIIGFVIFTGVVMMAAKHLDFTFANNIMIIFSIVLIVLEVKRSKGMKHIKNDNLNGFLIYKKFSQKILITEFLITAILYIGMLL